jgi:hypothetical protein
LRSAYYEHFHAMIRATAAALHPMPPSGWLFDVPGRGSTNDLVIFTGYGYYPRKDFAYENGDASLHAHLTRQELPVQVNPPVPDPKTEVVADTGGTNDFIWWALWRTVLQGGARPIPYPEGVVTPSASHGVHGIQFDGLSSLTPQTGQPKLVEGLGISLAYAIAGFLLNNGILTRIQNPLPGRGAVASFSAMM